MIFLILYTLILFSRISGINAQPSRTSNATSKNQLNLPPMRFGPANNTRSNKANVGTTHPTRTAPLPREDTNNA
jgi:hypothetical protein